MGSSLPPGLEMDVSGRLVEITFTGALTDAALARIHELLRSDDSIRPDFAAWADLRGADPRALTSRGLREVAGMAVPFEAASRCAIVVASDLAFGLARMYQMLRGGIEDTILVSRDADAARHWLGTPGAARVGA